MTTAGGPTAADHDAAPALIRGRLGVSILGAATLVPLLFEGVSSGGLAVWIWVALWAPACGALATSVRRGRYLWLPIAIFAAALFLGAARSPSPATGAGASLGLYLLGAASGCVHRSSFALAGCWLLGGGLLAALPSAAGIWQSAPGPEWLVATLDFSPVVWVCESAGFDWMRHSSVYEIAGAGDLGPHERLAWSGWLSPALLSASAALAIVALSWRAERVHSRSA